MMRVDIRQIPSDEITEICQMQSLHRISYSVRREREYSNRGIGFYEP